MATQLRIVQPDLAITLRGKMPPSEGLPSPVGRGQADRDIPGQRPGTGTGRVAMARAMIGKPKVFLFDSETGLRMEAESPSPIKTPAPILLG